ncbi:MAG: hypothetical protein FH758_03895 [Firmicutes bacterium]|nr:hypothetical protein [Bacillota bacterium]
MKKTQQNWYCLVSFAIFCILIISSYQSLVLALAGIFFILLGVLLKKEYVDYPDFMTWQKISNNKTITKNYHFYNDLFSGILLLLCSALSWLMHFDAFYLFLFVLIIRLTSYYYCKWFFKDSVHK